MVCKWSGERRTIRGGRAGRRDDRFHWYPTVISLALLLLFFDLTSGPGCLLPFCFFLPFLGSSVILISLTGIIHDFSHSFTVNFIAFSQVVSWLDWICGVSESESIQSPTFAVSILCLLGEKQTTRWLSASSNVWHSSSNLHSFLVFVLLSIWWSWLVLYRNIQVMCWTHLFTFSHTPWAKVPHFLLLFPL